MIPELHIKGRVTYPRSATLGLVGVPKHITVLEACGRHTLFVVTHQGRAKYAQQSLRSGAPMVVDLTAHKGNRRWFGYVDSVTEKDDEQGKTTEIIGVGVTYFMKDRADNVLGAVLPTERDLIKQAGLVPIVRGPDSDKPVLANGRSQWQVLTNTADEYGQYVFSLGTTIHVLRAHHIVEMFKQEAPRLVWRGNDTVDPWSLATFRAPVTDNVRDHKIAYGVDPVTASVTNVESGSSMFKSFPGYVARRVQEQMSSENLLQSATAEGRGHTEVVAGKLVYIEGSHPGPWWLVDSVTHEYDVEGPNYRMSLELHRTPSVINISDEHRTPRKNLLRRGDNGESVSRENDPKLDIRPMVLSGAVSWQNRPRWRAQ